MKFMFSVTRPFRECEISTYLGIKVYECCLVVSSPPAPNETGTMGREIKSYQGMGWELFKIIKNNGTNF
jgi:hypothetical protein